MAFCWTGKPATRHYARVSLFLALLVCWFAGTPGWASTVERVDVHHDRIVITFDQAVAQASSFMLDGPRRIAVDVDGVAPGDRSDAGGPVAAIRQGVHDGDGARIVFDLSRPAIVTDGGFDDGGRTLTLALASADEDDFARVATGRMTGYRSGAQVSDAGYRV